MLFGLLAQRLALEFPLQGYASSASGFGSKISVQSKRLVMPLRYHSRGRDELPEISPAIKRPDSLCALNLLNDSNLVLPNRRCGVDISNFWITPYRPRIDQDPSAITTRDCAVPAEPQVIVDANHLIVKLACYPIYAPLLH